MKSRIHSEQFYFDSKVRSKNSDQNYYVFGVMDLVFNRFMDHIGNIDNKTVLEVGCGTGWLTKLLLRKNPKLIAFDVSFESARMTMKKVKPLLGEEFLDDLLICKMNAESLGLKEEKFDIVVCWAIIHHTDIESTCDEIHRVLKKGGKAIMVEPLGHNLFINIYRKLTPNKRTYDEKPLKLGDLRVFRRKFRCFDQEEFYFLSLLSFFWYFIFRSKRLFLISQKILHKLDQRLFNFLPFIRKYCWYSIIILKK